MSNFDDTFENPFGKPSDETSDPFSDPAIQRATQKSNVQSGLAGYDPFGNEQGANQPAPGARDASPSRLPIYHKSAGDAQPAIMHPSQETQPPPYSRSGQQQATTQEVENRQDSQQQPKPQEAPYNVRRNNWPPLPEKCCFQPCFYEDISVDIPFEFQKTVHLLYNLWMFHASVMILNVIGAFALLIHSGQFETFGLAILYTIIFTPFSFLCWYRPVYKAFRSDSSFNFMVFFFVFFFQFIVSVVQTVGFKYSGFCGFITAISCFDATPTGIAVGVMVLLIALCFGIAACMDIILLTKVHRIYRSSGASMAKAQEEFTTGFMSNQHVQGAVTNAAAAAVSRRY